MIYYSGEVIRTIVRRKRNKGIGHFVYQCKRTGLFTFTKYKNGRGLGIFVRWVDEKSDIAEVRIL